MNTEKIKVLVMASGKSRKEESNKVTDISKSSSLLKNQEVHILYYL